MGGEGVRWVLGGREGAGGLLALQDPNPHPQLSL